MALVKGTNCGFVLAAPVADPAGNGFQCSDKANALKDVAPVGAMRVVEIGWWCDNATEAADYDMALYDHDSGNDRPGNRLYVIANQAKGTSGGEWKTVAVDWAVSGSTTYWIALQLDDTATTTNTDYTASGGRNSRYEGITALPDPWGGLTESTAIFAIYAKYETGGAPSTSQSVFTNNRRRR